MTAADRVTVLLKARQMGARAMPQAEFDAALSPCPEHWYTAWDRKHEAQQARTKARNLEFIFLDMASQACTIEYNRRREAK